MSTQATMGPKIKVEVKANTQLIAAAPDLYEALKSLYDVYSMLNAHKPNDPFLVTAQNALNKATGDKS